MHTSRPRTQLHSGTTASVPPMPVHVRALGGCESGRMFGRPTAGLRGRFPDSLQRPHGSPLAKLTPSMCPRAMHTSAEDKASKTCGAQMHIWAQLGSRQGVGRLDGARPPMRSGSGLVYLDSRVYIERTQELHNTYVPRTMTRGRHGTPPGGGRMHSLLGRSLVLPARRVQTKLPSGPSELGK